MKNLLLIALLLVTANVFGQRFPQNFTEVTAPDSSNFEVYSQKSGLPRRANLNNMKKYYDQEIYIINDTTICLTSANGDTCLSLAYFKQELSIVSDSLTLTPGNKIALSDISSATDDQNLSFSGDTLYIENGNNVDLGDFRQYVDSVTIVGDSMYFSLSNDNVPKTSVYVGDFLTSSTSISHDDLTSGSVTASVQRYAGSATTLTNPGAGVYDLDIKTNSEVMDIDFYGDSGDLDGSNQFTITIDNSSNLRDLRFNVQLYDGTTGSLVDQQATGTNHTQTWSGNVTTLIFPNMNGFVDFRILLR